MGNTIKIGSHLVKKEEGFWIAYREFDGAFVWQAPDIHNPRLIHALLMALLWHNSYYTEKWEPNAIKVLEDIGVQGLENFTSIEKEN